MKGERVLQGEFDRGEILKYHNNRAAFPPR